MKEPRMTRQFSRRRGVAVLLALAVPLSLASCSSNASPGASTASTGSVDNGTTLTMWVRSATDQFSTRLVDAYNTSHKNQVKLTVIPNDNYLQKVGAAAGANALPDLLAADVVYAPNYTSKGLYVDISARVATLAYADKLAPSHLAAGSWKGKLFAVPHKLDSSVMFYNKDLFTAAGLDPEKPPTNFTEVLADARKISALGGGKYGFNFGGNCGGCGVYAMFPYSWAAGSDILSSDGKKADFDNASFRASFALYKTMWDEKLVPQNAMTEDGSTWQNSFLAGDVGIFPQGSPIVGDLLKQTKFKWGVTALMAPDGSAASTFVGGDVAGITRSSKSPDAAWDFLKWSLDEPAQVEIIAKNGDLPGRLDLTNNKYTGSDPRTKLIADGVAKGHTPFALPFGDLFNNPNGPWVAMMRGAIFGNNPDAAIKEGQTKIQAGLDAANK
jgi:multiple sugar transport system substrate-binding protein